MDFWSDDRGAAIQIGAVILFAFVVIAMASYQATVVPSQNSGVEFNHNQDVQSQLVDLTTGLDASARDGTRGSHAVRLGTTYPSRTLFVNPGPPSGQLRTVESGQIELDITVDDADNVQTFWDNADPITTNRLQYEPNYHAYQSAPTTVYEHGELINDNPRGSPTTLSSGNIVDDGELSLITLRGEVGSASSSTVSVDRRSLSNSDNTVTVTDGTITLPIRSDADRYQSYWVQRLSGQDGITNVQTNGAAVQFDIDGELDLRMAELGVGSVTRGEPDDRAAYLYQVNTATVEVRDRLNNPVEGATVEYEDQTNGDTDELISDADGRVSVGADRAGNEINWSIDEESDEEPDPGSAKTLKTTVQSADVGGGESGGNGGDSSSAYAVEWDTEKIDAENAGVTCDSSSCTITNRSGKTFYAYTEPSVDGGSVEYASGDGSVVSFESSTEPISGGESEVPVTIGDDGTTDVFASSGGSGDRLSITVAVGGGGGGPLEQVAYVDSAGTLVVHYSDGAIEQWQNTADARAIGPTTDVDGDGDLDIPFVDTRDVQIVDSDGNESTLATDDAKNSRVTLGAGDTDEDGNVEVYYVDDSDTLVRVEDGTAEAVRRCNPSKNNCSGEGNQEDVTAPGGIAGIADFDGDGNRNLIYVNGAGDLVYLDPNAGEPEEQSTGYVDIQSPEAVGEPFEYDGTTVVPVVDDGANKDDIVLVDSTGTTTPVTTDRKVTASPLAPRDWDGDGDIEVLHMNNADSDILYYASVTDDDYVPVEDTGDNNVSPDKEVGVR